MGPVLILNLVCLMQSVFSPMLLSASPESNEMSVQCNWMLSLGRMTGWRDLLCNVCVCL